MAVPSHATPTTEGPAGPVGAAAAATTATTPPRPVLTARPRHVAIIMDSNGRWAQARGLGRSEGHRAGAEAIRPVIQRLGEHGVAVLTLFG